MRIPGNRNFQIKCSAQTGNQPSYSLKLPFFKLPSSKMAILKNFFCTQFRHIGCLYSLFVCE